MAKESNGSYRTPWQLCLPETFRDPYRKNRVADDGLMVTLSASMVTLTAGNNEIA